MSYLSEHYTPISLESLVEHLREGAPVPERAFVVTFDDGYRNVATVAAPILAELGIPATLFVTTRFSRDSQMLWTDRLIAALELTSKDHVRVQRGGGTLEYAVGSATEKHAADKAIRLLCKSVEHEERLVLIDAIVRELGVGEDQLMTAWDDHRPVGDDDLKQLGRLGVSVGSHTATHAILTRCSEEKLALELSESKAFIEEKTGEPCTLFSYPNGSVTDFSARTGRAVRDAGYVCALTTVARRVDRGQDVFEIPRYIVTHNEITLAEFAAEVSGFATFVRSAQDVLTRVLSLGTRETARARYQRIGREAE
jgi:peptidoglycan/xylan/chitin deacetylase (PgdA/CDA1 family)